MHGFHVQTYMLTAYNNRVLKVLYYVEFYFDDTCIIFHLCCWVLSRFPRSVLHFYNYVYVDQMQLDWTDNFEMR